MFKKGLVSIAILFASVSAHKVSAQTAKHVDANGMTFAYVEAGSGPPVVLIHGSVSDYREWSKQMKPLARRYRVIAYSRRYHWPNARPGTGADSSHEVQVEDLAAIIKALKLGPVHLVGHSFGGAVTLHLALRYPELVRSLVLAEPGVGSLLGNTPEDEAGKKTPSFRDRMKEVFAQGDPEQILRTYAAVNAPGVFEKVKPDVRQMLLENVPAFKLDFTSRRLPFTCEMGGHITAPALVLSGDRSDPFLQQVAEKTAACLKDARFVSISKATHWIPHDQPQKFSEALLGFLVSAQDRAGMVIFQHANVIDGISSVPLRDVTVIIANGKITGIQKSLKHVPAGAEVIDLKGKWLLPGYIDAHVHFNDFESAQTALRFGITTARTMGIDHFIDIGIRDAHTRGRTDIPEVLAAGYQVRPDVFDAFPSFIKDFPELADMKPLVSGTENVRRVVRALASRGVDHIKILATERAGTPDTDPRKRTFTDEELNAIVDEARKAGLKVAAHAHPDDGAYAAVQARVRSIEHGTWLSDKTLRLMRSRGTWLATNIFSDSATAFWESIAPSNPILVERRRTMRPSAIDVTQRAYKLGVPLVAATDITFGGVLDSGRLTIADNAAGLAEAGIPKMEAIKAITSQAAKLLEIDKRTGAIRRGLEADIVIIGDNPLSSIGALKDIRIVVNDGKVAWQKRERDAGVMKTDQALGSDFRNCIVGTRDFYVPHISTVDFNAGERVNLFVRERSCGGNIEKNKHDRPAVLLIQGRSAYAIPSYDLRFKNYSWMEFLAKRGFDVYAMDLQGYGGSTIPSIMNNPCNANAESQTKYLIPHPLATTCAPTYPKSFGNYATDWDEINTVIDYIRASQADPSAKVNLIGHSRGGMRVLGYAALHPDKIQRIVAFTPTRWPPTNANPQFPLNVVDKADYFADMNRQAKCQGQIEPGVQDALWSQFMSFDAVGSTWGPRAGTGIRRYPSFASGAGWQDDIPKRIRVPTLVIRGEFDDASPASAAQDLYNLIPAQKVYVTVRCAGHELPMETRHEDLYDLSAQWLTSGSVDGCSNNCSITK